jgi:hypothetical protein
MYKVLHAAPTEKNGRNASICSSVCQHTQHTEKSHTYMYMYIFHVCTRRAETRPAWVRHCATRPREILQELLLALSAEFLNPELLDSCPKNPRAAGSFARDRLIIFGDSPFSIHEAGLSHRRPNCK